MKKLIFIFLIVTSTTTMALCQAPQKLSYQAVIRNSSDALVTNSQIGMEIKIREGSPTGTIVYSEIQTPTTNTNGLVSIEIGGSSSFNSLGWNNGPYFLESNTAITPPLTTYTITGVSQLLSVPYAFVSNKSNIVSHKATNSPTYPFTLFDDNGFERFRMQLNYTNLATQLDFEATPPDNISDVNYRFFRGANTTGLRRISFFRGNGTSNVDAQIGIDGVNSYFNLNGGNFGIGISTPQRTLHIKSVMRLEPIDTPPINPGKGDMYFDNTLNKLRVFDGTNWQSCW